MPDLELLIYCQLMVSSSYGFLEWIKNNLIFQPDENSGVTVDDASAHDVTNKDDSKGKKKSRTFST